MRVQRPVLVALGALVLACQAPAASASRYELHLLDVGSGADRTVVRSDAHEYTPVRFEPGGGALTLLRSGGGHDQLQRLSLADGRRTLLTPQRLPEGSPPFPAVSVDGRLAAPAPIVRGRKVTYHVWIGRPGGEVITWLAPHYRFDPAVTWSADGHRLVVVGPRSLSRWTVDVFARTGRLVRSVSLEHTRYLQAPALSPDGSRLLVNRWSTLGRGPSKASVVDLESGRVALLSPAFEGYEPGGGRYPLSDASWSPDGRAVLALREPGLRIDLFDAPTLQRVETLVPAQPVWGSAAWSPDGRRALLLELGDIGNGLLLVDLGGEAPALRELVGVGRRDIVAAVWAPDSQTIAYDSSR